MTDEQEQTSEEAVPGDSSLPDETVSDEEPASNIAGSPIRRRRE